MYPPFNVPNIRVLVSVRALLIVSGSLWKRIVRFLVDFVVVSFVFHKTSTHVGTELLANFEFEKWLKE